MYVCSCPAPTGNCSGEGKCMRARLLSYTTALMWRNGKCALFGWGIYIPTSPLYSRQIWKTLHQTNAYNLRGKSMLLWVWSRFYTCFLLSINSSDKYRENKHLIIFRTKLAFSPFTRWYFLSSDVSIRNSFLNWILRLQNRPFFALSIYIRDYLENCAVTN